MADISKIVLENGNEYNLKDSTARSELDGCLKKTGGTLTGALTLDKLSGTANKSYVTASSFVSDPPLGTNGQIIFVIQGV